MIRHRQRTLASSKWRSTLSCRGPAAEPARHGRLEIAAVPPTGPAGGQLTWPRRLLGSPVCGLERPYTRLRCIQPAPRPALSLWALPVEQSCVGNSRQLPCPLASRWLGPEQLGPPACRLALSGWRPGPDTRPQPSGAWQPRCGDAPEPVERRARNRVAAETSYAAIASAGSPRPRARGSRLIQGNAEEIYEPRPRAWQPLQPVLALNGGPRCGSPLRPPRLLNMRGPGPAPGPVPQQALPMCWCCEAELGAPRATLGVLHAAGARMR